MCIILAESYEFLLHGRRNKIHFICRPIIFPFGELPRLSPATPSRLCEGPARSGAEVVKNTTVWLWCLPKETEVPRLAFPGETGTEFSWHMTLWMWGAKQRHLVWRNPFWHFPGKLPDNCYVHSVTSEAEKIARGFKLASALRLLNPFAFSVSNPSRRTCNYASAWSLNHSFRAI